MIKDLRSEAAKKESADHYKKWTDGLRLAERVRQESASKIWRSVAPWRPIEKCPFRSYEYQNILVSDGKTMAVAYVTRRFGTPMECVKEPEMALTDHGVAMVGGVYRKPKHPSWWFKWELADAFDDPGEYGRRGLDFVPTKWLPLPPP